MNPTHMVDENSAMQVSDGAAHRLRRWFIAVAMIADAILLARRHWPAAAGFGIGAVVAFVAMVYLQRTTEVFAEQVLSETGASNGGKLTRRILVRYVAVAIIAYGIFVSSRLAFFGFLGGLFVPVAAMTCEAAYEGWLAMRGKL